MKPMIAVTFNMEKAYSASPKVLMPQRLMEVTASRKIVILAQVGIEVLQNSRVITAAIISTGMNMRH